MRRGISLLQFPMGRPAVEVLDSILTGNDWQMYNNITIGGKKMGLEKSLNLKRNWG